MVAAGPGMQGLYAPAAQRRHILHQYYCHSDGLWGEQPWDRGRRERLSVKEEGGTLVMDRSNRAFDSHSRKLIRTNSNEVPGRDQTGAAAVMAV